MKFNLLFILLIVTHILSAQTFTEATGISSLMGVRFSAVAFSDIDGDGDQDVLITGLRAVPGDIGYEGFERISILYSNDGSGVFHELADTPFEGVSNGTVTFADVDGDGDQDVLLTGSKDLPESDLAEQIAKLYINDGNGSFSESINTPFEGVWDSAVAFSDVDNDGDQDVLISGQSNSALRISKLYTNDGNGHFNEMASAPFEGAWGGSVVFSDVDGDGDQDVLITGQNDLGEQFSKLYTNDGNGKFTEMLGTPFEAVWKSAIAFSDMDGDGDQDVLITGLKEWPGSDISKLYTNDGNGMFSEMTDIHLTGISHGSVAFSDVDNDGDKDLLIAGLKNADAISKLYSNDGNGVFSEMMPPPFDPVGFSSIAFSDIDNDGDDDVLISGLKIVPGVSPSEHISKLYINDETISSIHGLTLNSNFTAYPNPTQNNLTITFEPIEKGLINLKVYDVNGRILSQQKEFVSIGVQTISINTTSLSPGSYFIQLDDGKRQGLAKFIVQ